MKKQLSEMSLQELWQLFPIVLREHDKAYADWYAQERERVLSCVKDSAARIHHVGSTAVQRLLAKPTVDILLELRPDADVRHAAGALQNGGWTLMHVEDSPIMWYVFNKGYTPEGFAEKVFHLHMRFLGDWDELYFRDYLRAHSEAADEYARLKKDLFKRFEHDRDGYTAAKGDFVREHIAQARREFPGRHLPKAF